MTVSPVEPVVERFDPTKLYEAASDALSEPDAEVALLGAVLMKGDAAQEILLQLDAAKFTSELRRSLYRALDDAVDGGGADGVTLASRLRAEGRADATWIVAALAAACPTDANWGLHLDLVNAAARERAESEARRRLRSEDRSVQDGARIDLDVLSEQGSGSGRSTDVVSAGELIGRRHRGELPSRRVLIEGVLRAGDNLAIFGPPGMGKSQLSLAMSVSLALGGAEAQYVLDDVASPSWRVTSPEGRVVLYVNGEDEEADVAERLDRYVAARGFSAAPESLLFWTPRDLFRNLVEGRGVDRLEGLVRSHGAQVLFIDNITNVCAGMDKASESEVTAWFNRVPRRLRDRYGVTSVLLGHANKGTQNGDARSALERLFGSMAWGACLDGAVMLDWCPGEATTRRLLHAKSRGFAPFSDMRLVAAPGDCVFDVVGALPREDVHARQPHNKVPSTRYVEALVGREWTSKDELAELVGVSERTLRNWMNTEAARDAIEAQLAREIPEAERPTKCSPKKEFFRLRDPALRAAS